MIKDIVDNFKNKEKIIHDLWVTKRGFEVIVSPQDNSTTRNSDPFQTPINYLDNQELSKRFFLDDYNAYCIFVQDFEFSSIPINAMIVDRNNFSNIKAYISGDLVPMGSIIKTSFGYTLEIDKVKKRRNSSNIYEYSLTLSNEAKDL